MKYYHYFFFCILCFVVGVDSAHNLTQLAKATHDVIFLFEPQSSNTRARLKCFFFFSSTTILLLFHNTHLVAVVIFIFRYIFSFVFFLFNFNFFQFPIHIHPSSPVQLSFNTRNKCIGFFSEYNTLLALEISI